MDFGSPATGVLWSFKPGVDEFNTTSVIAFQVTQVKEGEWASKAVVRAMGVLLLFQLVVTLFFYARICYVSIMATMKIALKDEVEEQSELQETIEKYKANKDEETLTECNRYATDTNMSNFEESSSITFSKNNSWVTHDIEEQNPAARLTPNYKLSIPRNVDAAMPDLDKAATNEELRKNQPVAPIQNNISDSNDLSNADPDAIFTISSEIINSSDRLETLSESEKDPKITPEPHIEHESANQRLRASSNLSSMQKRRRRRKKRPIIPTAEDYKPVLPSTEARLVNIPLTSAVICVSRKDIICTASLSLQVLCLLATHFLSMYTYKISGKEVPLERYLSALRTWEISLLMITMVDPLSCIIFSSSYRAAARDILQKCISNRK